MGGQTPIFHALTNHDARNSKVGQLPLRGNSGFADLALSEEVEQLSFSVEGKARRTAAGNEHSLN